MANEPRTLYHCCYGDGHTPTTFTAVNSIDGVVENYSSVFGEVDNRQIATATFVVYGKNFSIKHFPYRLNNGERVTVFADKLGCKNPQELLPVNAIRVYDQDGGVAFQTAEESHYFRFFTITELEVARLRASKHIAV